MSVGDFLKGLPCHNANNFALFNTDNGIRTSQKRPSVYLPTEDYPSEQVIVMDKRCILLRYLTQQWEKKTMTRKREHNGDVAGSGTGAATSGTPTASGTNGNVNNGTSGTNGNSCKKRPRLEAIDMN